METSDSSPASVPVTGWAPSGRGRCRCCGSCGGCELCRGEFWSTKWLRRRLFKEVGTKTAGVIVALLTFFLLGFGAATALLSLECTRSNAMEVVFTVAVSAGLVSTGLLLWVARRDPYEPLVEETEEDVKVDRAKSAVAFVVLTLLAIACMIVDINALVVANSCSLAEGSLPSNPHISTVFHVVRLFFVVAQVSSVGWLHMTRTWAKQTAATAFLTAFVIMADAACWLYQVSESTDIVCDTSVCWDSDAPTAAPCEGSDRTTHCEFLGLKRYCNPLIGQFGVLATATMYALWSKARGFHGACRESENGQRLRGVHGNAAPGWLFFVVVLLVLSVALVLVAQRAALPPTAETSTTMPTTTIMTTTLCWGCTKAPRTARPPTTTITTTATTTTAVTPKYADNQAVFTYHVYKVVYVFVFALAALLGEIKIKSGSNDRLDSALVYWPHIAHIVVLGLGAIAMTALNLMSLFALARTKDDDPEDYVCRLLMPSPDNSFANLRVLLAFDAVFNTLLIVFQTTFLLAATCQSQKQEGALNTSYSLLVLFNLCLWINGSFLEVQSAPTTTCWQSPVQRVAFRGYWNKLLHLFYPLFMLYWLQALVMAVNLRLRTLILSPQRAGRVQPLGTQPEPGTVMQINSLN